MKTLGDIMKLLETIPASVLEREYVAGQFGLRNVGYDADDGASYDDPSSFVFTEKFFEQWRCTDTHVGYSIVYMDGEPVAMVTQEGRKCDKVFHWIGGVETYQRVFQRCVGFIRPDEYQPPEDGVLTEDTVLYETEARFRQRRVIWGDYKRVTVPGDGPIWKRHRCAGCSKSIHEIGVDPSGHKAGCPEAMRFYAENPDREPPEWWK